MCLTTEQKWPKIAWKPITTYKVVASLGFYLPLFTLFRAFPIQIGRTYRETLINILKNRTIGSIKNVMHQGLHSCKAEYQARLIAHFNKECNPIVVECTIPRFSLYWIGDNGDIVSNKLKYVKIL